MTDRLVEIQYSDLPTLKKLYSSDELRCHIGYMTIDTYIRLLEKFPEESKCIKFFCLNGDFSDGTFIVTVCIFFSITRNFMQTFFSLILK